MEKEVYSAATVIDELLEMDDGELLAAVARFKSSVIVFFGRDGIVEIIRKAVDNAPNVEYFSRRSRKEIDPTRPEVQLRVDHEAAIKSSEALKQQFGHRLRGAMTEKEILDVKAAVIHDQVCMVMMNEMNEAFRPHWGKAKDFADGLKEGVSEKLRLMVCTFFSVRVGNDSSVPLNDRQCTMLVMV